MLIHRKYIDTFLSFEINGCYNRLFVLCSVALIKCYIYMLLSVGGKQDKSDGCQ